MPDVSAAELDAWQIQRGAAQHGDCFRFTLLEVPRGQLAAVAVALRRVTEEHMRQFVKARRVRQRTGQRDGDRSAARDPSRFP